jgi:hypothetical protein
MNMNHVRVAPGIALALLFVLTGCTPPSSDPTPADPSPTRVVTEPSPTPVEEPAGPVPLADGVLLRISTVAVAPTGERLTLVLDVADFVPLADAPSAQRSALLAECTEFIAVRGLGPDGGPVLDVTEWAGVAATLTATGDDWPTNLQIQASQGGRIFTGAGGAISPVAGAMACDRPIHIAGAGVTSLFSAKEAFPWDGGVDGALDTGSFSIAAVTDGILFENCTIELSPLAMEHDDQWQTLEDTSHACRIVIVKNEND